MGCGCIKVSTKTLEERRKTMSLARKLAESEQQTYVIYEKENEEFADSLAAWGEDGRPGKLKAVIEP